MKSLCSICFLVLLTACGSAPKDRFYVLGVGESSGNAAPAKYTIAINAVSVPEVVDRPQLVLYQPDSRVEIIEHERWAEPLRVAIPGALARELRAQLPEARVAVYPQTTATDASCRISLDVQRFESRRAESAIVEALWLVRCADGRTQQGHSLIRENVQGDSFAALAAAHSRALAQISKELALTVRNLQAPKT